MTDRERLDRVQVHITAARALLNALDYEPQAITENQASECFDALLEVDAIIEAARLDGDN